MTLSPRLVLASASPRRRELLAEIGEPFEVRPADADERPLAGEKPEAMVIRLALAKARAAARAGEIALGADTVVALGDEIFGKPADADEAAAMLARLGYEEESEAQAALARMLDPESAEDPDADRRSTDEREVHSFLQQLGERIR